MKLTIKLTDAEDIARITQLVELYKHWTHVEYLYDPILLSSVLTAYQDVIAERLHDENEDLYCYSDDVTDRMTRLATAMRATAAVIDKNIKARADLKSGLTNKPSIDS